MSRRFTVVTLALTAVVAFLVGAIVAGGVSRSSMIAGTAKMAAARAGARPMAGGVGSPGASFADVVERMNPAVVNIDATSARARAAAARPERRSARPVDGPDYGNPRSDRDGPPRGAGTGFIIDADGNILTNNHVIDRADRITVKLSDGRSLRARVVGTDPDTDVALIKIDGQGGLPVAPLGDSSTLRAGEWVCAIGNPLGYEHTVTVGVVSYIGRKLFDESLDDYIQTDAAINFGNSGGPLINARGEVIGINAAISSRASSIGFAVPINLATAILPQLRKRGRVSRGYIGVALKDVDPDLRESLKLTVAHGALVQDVTDGSPAERAGLRPYDVIVVLDDQRRAQRRRADPRDLGAGAGLGGAAAPGAGRPRADDRRQADRAARARRDRGARPAGVAAARRTQDRCGRPAGAHRARHRPDDRRSDGAARRDAGRRHHESRGGEPVVRSRRRARDGPARDQSPAGDVGRRIPARGRRRRAPGEVLTLFLYLPDLDEREMKTVQSGRPIAAAACQRLRQPCTACPNHASWSSTTKRPSATRCG